jgi:predicted transport protein
MSNFGFYSEKSSITFESHLAGLQEKTRGLLLNLRAFIKSLGDNVIEEPRPHRIAYAKSLNFRVFADVQPKEDCLIVSIRRGRTDPLVTYMVKNPSELEAAKNQISEAYSMIK